MNKKRDFMSNIILQDITQIVPHRHPILMIDNYKRIDTDNAVAEKKFQEGDYGCEKGVVIDSILIECVAQSIAAHCGYDSFLKKEENPGIGMLVSVDTFDFYHPVKQPSRIDIIISNQYKIGAFKLFSGEIRLKNQIMAKGNIKVFNPEEKDE